ncbi:nascent polypeptide-associated complex subunit alpha, muscle-specific form-like [Bombyx mori]|uniref:nascent polypeptide-associated complex subunit alpha, muscle-specific form-like n=1 Tax=Bombyx mori TaxID=7091 RepID=UPI002ED3B6B6
MPSKVAVRGLPADTDTADVTNALKELGFPARYARCIRSKRGRPGSVFHVALDHLSKDELARLYSVNELMYLPGDHAAVDRRCPVYRKKARMMGVTVPPPVPPVPPVRRSGNAAPSAVAPTSKGKGKGKGKSSQPQPPPTSSFIPPAVTVEAEPSAATLMAEANTPRRGKPTPTPRSFAITRPTPKQDRAPARAGAPTPQAPNKKTLKNRKKKSKRKLMKKARREALENAAPSSVPAIPAIDMEVDINPTTDHIIDDQQPGPSSLPQAQPATSGIQPPLPPRPQRERRSGRQDTQPAGFAAWLLSLWEKLSERYASADLTPSGLFSDSEAAGSKETTAKKIRRKRKPQRVSSREGGGEPASSSGADAPPEKVLVVSDAASAAEDMPPPKERPARRRGAPSPAQSSASMSVASLDGRTTEEEDGGLQDPALVIDRAMRTVKSYAANGTKTKAAGRKLREVVSQVSKQPGDGAAASRRAAASTPSPALPRATGLRTPPAPVPAATSCIAGAPRSHRSPALTGDGWPVLPPPRAAEQGPRLPSPRTREMTVTKRQQALVGPRELAGKFSLNEVISRTVQVVLERLDGRLAALEAQLIAPADARRPAYAAVSGTPAARPAPVRAPATKLGPGRDRTKRGGGANSKRPSQAPQPRPLSPPSSNMDEGWNVVARRGNKKAPLTAPQPGHKAAVCLAAPHCSLCAAAGRKADHRTGGKACPPAGKNAIRNWRRQAKRRQKKRSAGGAPADTLAPAEAFEPDSGDNRDSSCIIALRKHCGG